MYGIVLGRQYIVSSEIYIIWICKHIDCWSYTLFTMCHPPSRISAWCDNLSSLPTREENPHLSTVPHLGASLSGTFDVIMCLCCHSFDATYVWTWAIPGPWDIDHPTSELSMCLFLTVLVFPWDCFKDFQWPTEILPPGLNRIILSLFFCPTFAVFCYLVVNVY